MWKTVVLAIIAVAAWSTSVAAGPRDPRERPPVESWPKVESGLPPVQPLPSVERPPPIGSGLPPLVSTANCAPDNLVRVTVRNVSPGLQAAASGAQPRTVYRQGSQFLRVEESPDFARGVQGLTVIAEPDLWLVNQADRTGRHGVDRSPPFEVHAPVVAVPGMPRAFLRFEFGCEMAFLAAYPHPPPRRMGQGANPVDVHVLSEGRDVLAVMVDHRRQIPLMVSFSRGGKPIMVTRYESYSASLPPRPQLFEAPSGVNFQEMGPLTPPPPADPIVTPKP